MWQCSMCRGDCLGVEKVTDEKNQGGGSAGTAAERLAKQRKALNLQTQPLEVIADLDWDVDDDDAEFTLPTPTPVKPKAAAPVRTSSGTMAMSAGDFAQAMKDEGIETGTAAAEKSAAAATAGAAAAAATAAAEKSAAAASAQTQATAKQAATRAQSSGGTMLLSGDAMQEALEAAKLEAESTGAEHRETAPHASIEREEQLTEPQESVQPQQSAGGTMLMSTDMINEQLEEQIREAQAITKPSDSVNTGMVEDTTSSAHEPQTPDWNEEQRPREVAEWTDPDVSDAVSKSSGFLGGMNPNTRVVLVLVGVLLVVILLWLIIK